MGTFITKCPECRAEVLEHNCEIKCDNCGYFKCCHDIF